MQKMKTDHTPGPWKCDLVSLKIWANDGNTEIALTSSDVSISEEEANARLISSAPDMLEALQDCLDYLLLDSMMEEDAAPEIEKIRKAIFKAKGELK
jgi:hypothetical protein